MIRLKSLITEQEQSIIDKLKATQVKYDAQKSTTASRIKSKTAKEAKPKTEEDGISKSIFQKLSDNFIAIYEKIDQLYKDKTYWSDFKGDWYSNDDEDSAVSVTFGENIDERGTWWFQNIQPTINSIESEVKRIDAINIDNLSPENIGRLKTAKRNLWVANSLYKKLREGTFGYEGSDEVSWTYYAGMTDSDKKRIFKVDTDF